jgi:hypothetical protein
MGLKKAQGSFQVRDTEEDITEATISHKSPATQTRP